MPRFAGWIFPLAIMLLPLSSHALKVECFLNSSEWKQERFESSGGPAGTMNRMVRSCERIDGNQYCRISSEVLASSRSLCGAPMERSQCESEESRVNDHYRFGIYCPGTRLLLEVQEAHGGKGKVSCEIDGEGSRILELGTCKISL